MLGWAEDRKPPQQTINHKKQLSEPGSKSIASRVKWNLLRYLQANAKEGTHQDGHTGGEGAEIISGKQMEEVTNIKKTCLQISEGWVSGGWGQTLFSGAQ